MNARWPVIAVALGLLAASPAHTDARGLDVEVWTNRGDDAVYQPGENIEIQARAGDDAYLLVYEIDAEGSVRLLYPYRGSTGFVEGRRTYRVPPERSDVDLVVQGPVGQCYVVAIASRDRFLDLPWYLRPYDLQAESVGYEGASDDEQGVTAEGRIVGDPFVAMERIRRRVLRDANDAEAFGTSYATYYVHNEVRYPRYLCYDCHRPGRWAWWSGFDPYYSSCSVIDLRVNWNWGWGPGYWFGCVPYYNFVARRDCPPRYRPYFQRRPAFSSWDGWRCWSGMWGSRLVRYKSDPPASYRDPTRFKDPGAGSATRTGPPGFITREVREGRDRREIAGFVGRGIASRPPESTPREGGPVWRRGGADEVDRPIPQPLPAREVTRDPEGGGTPRGAAFRDGDRRRPPRAEGSTTPEREWGGRFRDWIRQERPRLDRPRESGRAERPRLDRPRDAGREERPRIERPRDERPAERGRGARPADSWRSSEADRDGRRGRN